LKLHSILLDSVRGRDKGRGRFRTIQNYIGAPNSALEDAAFVPPPANQIPTLLDNWEKYYHMERPDPLVQLAVIHAQFEIIHPFLDGNGRLGRILLPLYLYEKKILRQPMFYLSAYLDKNRDSYIENLRNLGVVEGSWNTWIAFFLTALIEQAQQNAQKAHAVMDLYESLKTRVINLTQSKFAVPLLDVLFERPILRSTQLDSIPGMPSRAMINTLLNKLKSDGILKVIAKGRGQRAQVLALAELLNLCEGKSIV
jgi:cell filamentation protein, protein adenylyltransferase